MKIIDPSVEILTNINSEEVMKHLERCGRVCYKSEDKIGVGSSDKFIANIIKRGHESVLEHFNFTVLFVCDRGVSHELVRHRLASFSQESTRYCNYSKDKFGSELTFIDNKQINHSHSEYVLWFDTMRLIEQNYLDLIKGGIKPEIARSILPNSLKTEIVVTANLREWRHILKLRTSLAAHPDIRVLMQQLLDQLKEKLPIIFSDFD